MSRLQTEMGSPFVKPNKSRSLMQYIFNEEPLSKKGRLAIPSRGVQTTIEGAEKMPNGGAKDTLMQAVSNKYQYEASLEGNEGAPMSRYDSIHVEHFAYIMFEPTRYEKDLRPYINAYGPTLRIPVSPATLAITKEAEHNEVQSVMFGGILERNAPGLRHFSVTSFIPGTPYTTGYGDYRFQNYYPWAEDLGGGVRVYTNGTLNDDNLICTQTGWVSFVNLLMDRRIILKFHLVKAPAYRHRDECFNVCIKSFTYQHNPHDDLDYTIEFIEWREPSIRVGEEQVIDLKEDTPPAHKKSPAGGQILLVMHEFQGVNTMLLNNAAQVLMQIHGGRNVSVYESMIPNPIIDPTITMSLPLKSWVLSDFKAKKMTDEDFRPSKMTTVSLGIKPQNYSGLNELGYKAYSLSQTSKAEAERFKSELEKIAPVQRVAYATVRPVSSSSPIVYSDDAIKAAVSRAVETCFILIDAGLRDAIREKAHSIKWLKPAPLKLYDGGDFTGYGESGEIPTYDGSIQAHRRDMTDITDTLSWATAATAATSDNFTANPVYDADSKTMNINRSGIHDLIIDETGQVRYDDLVRRVKKFNIPLRDYRLSIWIKVLEIRLEDKGTYLDFTVRAEGSLNVSPQQLSNDLYSTVDTVGTKLYKGQRITVLDSHLRAPTKTELALQKRQREWDRTRGDRPRS